MKKLQEGWNKLQGTSIDVFVENGKVLRGTAGEGVYYRTVYPYIYSVEKNAYENISGISIERYVVLANENRVSWH